MKRLIYIVILICSSIMAESQNIHVQGIVLDSKTREPLAGVSILIFQSGTTAMHQPGYLNAC